MHLTTEKSLSLGLNTESDYPGVYKWNHITGAELSTDANAEAMSFQNWQGSNKEWVII